MSNSLSLQARLRRVIGDFNVDAPGPRIACLRSGTARPVWSVMIPTYNCARYLRQALTSVLAQAPEPAEMQIEVVDDVSTNDDPESIVREVGRGRVAFFRRPANGGVTANFNTCLERSRGQLVHILHGDDFVESGFYACLAAAATEHPRTAALFARCRVVGEDGALESVAPRIRALEAPTRNAAALHQTNSIYTPGIVVRRSFYEKHGGFRPDLVHCADWEMWVRTISRSGGMMLKDVLASYRFCAGNDTNRLARSAENIRDRLRLAAIFACQFPDFDFGLCERTLARQALRQMQRYAGADDREGALANQRMYHLLASPARRRLLRLWDREIGIKPVAMPRALRRKP